MILLGTNAILWLLAAHPRAEPLVRQEVRLYVSPVSLLEMKYLVEVGRLHVAEGRSVEAVVEDPRWQLDSPASDVLFKTAMDLDWTRDPFDRLLAAHAQCRGWRLASGDRELKAKLPSARIVAL